jgi:hypothetical protein
LCVTLSDRQDHEHKPTLRKIQRGVANALIHQKNATFNFARHAQNEIDDNQSFDDFDFQNH